MNRETICYAAVFLAEAQIAWLYFDYLFAKKRRLSVMGLSFLLVYFALFVISRLGNTEINIASFYLFNCLLLLLNFRCGVRTALLHAAFLSFIMSASETLFALLISLFGYEFSAYTNHFSVMVAMAIGSKLLYMALALTGARVFSPHKSDNKEPQMMVLFCCLPVASVAIAGLIVFIGLHMELDDAAELMILINVFSLLAVNLIFMVLYNHLQKVSAETISLRLSMQKEAADAAYYEALREQSENQRILVHDMKNHLQTIDSLARDGSYREINDYISRLDETLRLEAPARLCGDPILNTVLLRAAGECREKGIDFQCDVREDTVFFLDALGITTLFGNLLSNAIEAAEVSAGKVVELSVRPSDTKASIIISVVNSCDIAPIPAPGGGFHTRKRDKVLHGIGLKSIGRVVERYRGIETMYYRPQDHSFHHIIQFPSQ